MRSLQLLAIASILVSVFGYSLETHDASFQPDIILRITAQNISLNCESRFSTIVNGSVPGPTLRIPEGEKRWIRVYNDQSQYNLTIVSISFQCLLRNPDTDNIHSIGMA